MTGCIAASLATALALVLAVAVSVPMAGAQVPAIISGIGFDDFDADGNGVVTATELRRGLDAIVREQSGGALRARDADGDGVLTRDEAFGNEEQRRRDGPLFDAADADGDGRVTIADLMKAALASLGPMLDRTSASLLETADANGDGVVSRDEEDALGLFIAGD